MSFQSMRVISLESRRSAEMSQLIRNQQGEPVQAPSMREAPMERNEEVYRFGERLFAGAFDMMILLTGVGTRLLNKALAERYPEERFAEALRGITTVVRGPKPAAALRELGVTPTVFVPEPNTWRELLASVDERPEKRIAVQEYGRTNDELIAGLRSRGAAVETVRIYRWELPEDTGPLEHAVKLIANGEAQVLLLTTSIQIAHLFQVAERMGLAGEVRRELPRIVIASIGPTTTESLEEFGFHPDLEPSHPKMGFLVKETAQRAPELLEAKRER